MVKVRTGKIKGNQFEYDCQHSLSKIFGENKVTRTSERGYQLQYDLKIETYENNYIAVECKREAGFTWNKIKNYFEKLEIKCPEAINHYLLFKGNRQPCLVMYRESPSGKLIVMEFEDLFGKRFDKHNGVRK